VRQYLLLVLLCVSTVTKSQVDELSLSQDAKQYAQATLSGDFATVIRYTYQGLLKINGGKSRLKQDFISKEQEMIDLGELRFEAAISGVSTVNEVGNNLFAIVHIAYLTSSPGGIFRHIVPILGVSEDKGGSWKFLEAKKLTNPRVRMLFPKLNVDELPKFSTIKYLEQQTFSKEMITYNRSLAHKLHTYDLHYLPPKGYSTSDTSFMITNRLEFNHHTAIVSSKSKSGILVCISFNGIDTSSRRQLSGFPGPDGLPFDINKNWIPSFGVKYRLFPSSYSQEMYNADVSGTFEFEPGKLVPIIARGEKCRVLFIHKDNWLDIEIMYCYTADSEHQLDNVMEETKNILKFRY
jgi:hypothetical protein